TVIGWESPRFRAGTSTSRKVWPCSSSHGIKARAPGRISLRACISGRAGNSSGRRERPLFRCFLDDSLPALLLRWAGIFQACHRTTTEDGCKDSHTEFSSLLQYPFKTGRFEEPLAEDNANS